MYCNNCGMKPVKAVNFCNVCGGKIWQVMSKDDAEAPIDMIREIRAKGIIDASDLIFAIISGLLVLSFHQSGYCLHF